MDKQELHWSLPEQEKLNKAIEECVNSLVREESERNYRKDTVESIQEDIKIKPALFNALVKERYEAKSSKTLEKHEDIVAMNEMLVNNFKKSVA